LKESKFQIFSSQYERYKRLYLSDMKRKIVKEK